MAQLKLNKIEKLKRALRPIDYYLRLDALEAGELDEADRFYLKNFGIYNHKLAPERFILRIRIPGGRLKVDRLRRLTEIAERAGAGIVITSRAQLELHGLSLRQAVEISRRIETFGLTSWQTYTDNFRNIVTHPLDGLGDDALIECQGLVTQMQALFLKRPDFVGELPRKFNTAIIGNRHQLFSPFANDLAFVVARKDDRIGFNLYAGGKNSEVAHAMDCFVGPDRAVAMFEAVATLYRDEGPRQSRSRARLHHMIEAMRMDRFREKVTARLGWACERAGELLSVRGSFRERYPLGDGSVVMRYTTRFGEGDCRMLREVADVCEEHGVGEVRLGCDQNIYIPHLSPDIRFRYAASHYGGMVACAGSKYCVYSLLETKSAGSNLALKKCAKLGISIGLSGCLKGCARHAVSDIGLVGIRTKLFAEEVERGVRLYLGAEHSRGERAARLILYSVPMRALDAMIDLIADLFDVSGYEDFEIFARKLLNRYSEPALAFWLLYNYHRRHVRKEAGLMLPDPAPCEDEKACFLRYLLATGLPEDRDIAEYLRCQEAFPFREAIIFLERACFSVKSPS